MTMESKRIKSAWEIALERAERLGSLSSEELKVRQEEEAREIGRGLAARWHAGLRERDMQAELAKFDADRRSIVKDEVVASLIGSLSIRPDARALRSLEGLRLLIGANALRPVEDQVSSLWRECDEGLKREGERWTRKIRADGESELRKRGVSGSALTVNPKAFPEWQAAMKQIEASYHERLAEVGHRIAALIASA